MLSDNITIDANASNTGVPGATTVDALFNLTGLNGSNSTRQNPDGLTNGAPWTLRVEHGSFKSKSNSQDVERHVVRIDRGFPATDELGKRDASVYLTIVRPIDAAVTTQIVKDQIGYLVGLLVQSGVVDKILNNEP